ncbi:MAG: hypothetical protein U0800_06435 [Isosphaeraceae bacterium]
MSQDDQNAPPVQDREKWELQDARIAIRLLPGPVRMVEAYCKLLERNTQEVAFWGPLLSEVQRGDPNPGWGSATWYGNARQDEPLDERMRLIAPKDEISIPSMPPGQYYPRIWRGRDSVQDPVLRVHVTPYFKSFIDSVEQVEALFSELSSISSVAHLDPQNLTVYGSRIRQMIIVACTEFEAQCRGILKANGCIKPRFNTTDYVALLEPLKLNEYSVRLSRYPNLQDLSPFKDWSNSQPSQSITWYENYNKVKHDREGNFNLGNLGCLLECIAACWIMMAAQYGPQELRRYCRASDFQFVRVPEWGPSDWYFSPLSESWGWQSTPYQF